MTTIAPVLLPLMFVLFAGLVIAGAIAAHRRNQQRQAALAALGSEFGLSFDPGRDRNHDEQYAHFEIFRRGHSRAALNTMAGSLTLCGRRTPVKLGDFTYKVTSSNGKTTTTTTYHFSYLIVHLPFDGVPDLLIRPEGVFDRIGGVFSDKDIDFESEEFSRRYFVASPDRRFAYAVCHPRMMEYFLGSKPPAVDIERGRLCLADGSRRWTPEQFRGMIGWLDGFLGQWPEHVVTDLSRT